MSTATKLAAASDLLNATRRDLQLVDEYIERLRGGRSAVSPADDVSSEHRAYWIGVADDLDQAPGILIGAGDVTSNFGFENPKTGTLRNQEDAAFVCTDIQVAVGMVNTSNTEKFIRFYEYPSSPPYYNDGSGGDDREMTCLPFLRLIDGSSGRNLINGMTEGPKDLDRGAVPFSYLSSIRPGLGANVKNRLFSEFTIPRAGVVRAEVYNLGHYDAQVAEVYRVCVSLLGYKVFGG